MLLITKSSSFHVIVKSLVASSNQLSMKINTTMFNIGIHSETNNVYTAQNTDAAFTFHVIDGYIRSTDKKIIVALPEVQFYTGE